MKNKVYVYLTQEEMDLVIRALNDYRNKLIAEGRHIDLIDAVLYKAITAPTKKVKIA